MIRILVIRFGALGDLCLLAWSLSRLAQLDQQGEGPRVTLVTKSRFASLMGQVPGVDQVLPLTGPALKDLVALARDLRGLSCEAIIDAHNNLRSHLLLAMLARRPQRRISKDTISRLSLLFFRRHDPKLTRSMRDRFDELTTPWSSATVTDRPTDGTAHPQSAPPLVALADASDHTARLGIAPGARWATKRWPDSHFAVFVRLFRGISTAPVRLFLGPDEAAWYPGSPLERSVAQVKDVEVWANRSLLDVAKGLADCSTLLTNDSGLMHLAEATGTPVLGLFGPTVEEFGYFPSLPDSLVLQRDLDCRPCSRNGKRPCWREDKSCLTEISPAVALDRLMEIPPWRNEPTVAGHD